MRRKGLINNTLWFIVGLAIVILVFTVLYLIQTMGQNSITSSIDLVRNNEAGPAEVPTQNTLPIETELTEFTALTGAGG